MDDQWTIPPTDPQRHVRPTAEFPGPAFQPNMPIYQQGEDPTTQNCRCEQCSGVRRTQARPPTLYLDNTIAPYLNQYQDVDNRAETALIVPNGVRAQFAPPQTDGIQYNFGYAPTYERAGPPNMGLPMVPTLDTSIAESRRRLAGHYLNNPDAYVSTIRLEPSPSGQFQVIITLEMANVV